MRNNIKHMKDKCEFDDIFRLHYKSLFFFARQMVHDEEECSDIVLTAFEDFWDRFSDIHPSAVKMFLYKNVRNKCIDYLRHQQRHLQYIDFCLNMTKDYAEDKDIVEMEQRQKQIDATINQLQPPTRDIFLACYVELKKYKDVAAERGISVATVRKHIVKALRIIREYNKPKK